MTRGSTPARQKALVVAVVALAAVVRTWHLERLGFSHWDEAFFVGEGRWLALDGWPGLSRFGWFAPPGMGVSIGVGLRAFGSHNWVPFLVAALWGTVAVALVYLLGRSLFSRRVGLLAAALAAVSTFLVMYARLALADSMFLATLLGSLWLAWRAIEQPGTGRFALAGAATCLTTITKYQGFFALLVVLAWYGLELLRLGHRWRSHGPPLVRLATTSLATMVTAFLGLLWICKQLAPNAIAGPNTFRTGFASYLFGAPDGATPLIVAQYFGLWMAPSTIGAAILGLAILVFRWEKGDRFLAIASGGFLAAVCTYSAYPRLALPLAAFVVLLAARGADAIGTWMQRSATRAGSTAWAATVVAIVILEARGLPGLLGMETKGYERAAAEAVDLGRAGTVYAKLQPVFGLYPSGASELQCRDAVVSRLQTEERMFLLLDQTRGWDAAIGALLSANRDRLALIRRIPNPAYDELLLQTASHERLANLRHGAVSEDLRFIDVYEAHGPLVVPGACEARAKREAGARQ